MSDYTSLSLVKQLHSVTVLIRHDAGTSWFCYRLNITIVLDTFEVYLGSSQCILFCCVISEYENIEKDYNHKC